MIEYNKKYHKKPIGIQKQIREKLVDEEITPSLDLAKKEVLLPDEKEDLIKKLRKEMKIAAQDLNFERAAMIRDQIKSLKIS